ncbi:Class I triheme cytochrome c [Oceanicola granulosus HTCC2516]|uniref:Class I triheme cytochrome c n=1 Tax=Oceanicola granulosus (strain ATCC BAA-861 / DSM 15982 / KCTC 12143 / HTCC2516) TaxID=314256 RepID=Q2CAA8_OCEGH|nr:c-type cytochrome [Oceanicola granulosus]EAR49610.1 Class I triheme cytochrome c [Oceanicola granulosus HTCC2516]
MRRVLLTLAALAALGLVGAAATVGIGLYNVSAQEGHWPGVRWVLHTTFRNSVELRAMPEDAVPDLSDPALAALGARHFASACAPCHAAPGADRTATMRAMLPVPPPIGQAVGEWSAAELHWIVYNGIKMSGMPAWPGREREAEVWPVVAYLQDVQAGDGALPPPPPELPADAPEHAAYCAGCHGSIEGHVPRLDIQNAAYLLEELEEFREGSRQSGIMEHAASAVPEAALADLAAWFAARPATGTAGEGPREGAALAMRGTRDVPACSACHGPGATRARPDIPLLEGQDRHYLAVQLRLWRDGVRHGSELMAAAARELSDAEIDLLAAWYAAQEPRDAEEVAAP